jgi:hypothetical protein
VTELQIVRLVGEVLGLLLAFAGFAKLFSDFGALKLKTDTMWDVLLKGALVAAKRTGVLIENSPERVNPEVVKLFGKLGDRMRVFYYRNRLEQRGDNEVVLILARTFGDEIMGYVGGPVLPNFGAALIAALRLCKEEGSNG